MSCALIRERYQLDEFQAVLVRAQIPEISGLWRELELGQAGRSFTNISIRNIFACTVIYRTDAPSLTEG